jgi:RIO-like serine/threonine protein kinase
MENELAAHELALLRVLADEWIRSGPPGFVETTVIAKTLKMTIPETKSAIHSLFVRGLVGTDKIDIHAAYLTPDGFDISQSKS